MQRSILDFMVKSSPRTAPKTENLAYDRGDLVLAKVPTYQSWPAIVIEDPDERKFTKCEESKTLVHVVFIDDQPSRSWVELSNMEKYTAKSSTPCSPKATNAKISPSLKRSFEKADQLLNAPAVDRLLHAERELHAIATNTKSKAAIVPGCERLKVDSPKPIAKVTPVTSAKRSISRIVSPTETPTKKPRRVIAYVDEEESNSCQAIMTENTKSLPSASTAPSNTSAVNEKKHEATRTASKFLDLLSLPTRDSKKDDLVNNNERARARMSEEAEVDDEDVLNRSKQNDSFKCPTPKSSTKDSLKKTPKTKSVYAHHEFTFLRSDELKDAAGKRPDDPSYDPTTLHVPARFLDRETAAMRQWWVEKSRRFDAILCFKMGKFYEMYHMDAEIAVRECGLTMMRGGAAGSKNSHLPVAHCGFPEVAFARHAETLVSRGYKIARVEQTETPKLAAERRGSEKCVQRELCAIISPGIRPFNHFIASSDEVVEPAAASHNYLLVLTESPALASPDGVRIGCCFLDCSIGTVRLAEFDDDRFRTRLRTLLARLEPVEILFERHAVSRESVTIIDRCASVKRKETLNTEQSESHSAAARPAQSSSTQQSVRFPFSARATLRVLRDRYAYTDDSMPPTLRNMLQDMVQLIPKREFELTLRCIGALVSHLAACLFDVEVLSLRTFEMFEELLDQAAVPVQPAQDAAECKFDYAAPRSSTMMLDSVALANLELFANSEDGSRRGTLIGELDRCATSFGKRLLAEWLAAPLCSDVQQMRMRSAAVELLNKACSTDQRTRFDKQLSKLPDLDRLVARIHSWSMRTGSTKRVVSNMLSTYAASTSAASVFSESSVDARKDPKPFDRPDSRASFFGAETYNKRKVEQFARCLVGLHDVAQLSEDLRLVYDEKFKFATSTNCDVTEHDNTYFLRLLSHTVSDGGQFPDHFRKLLAQFDAIDLEHARRNGVIQPPRGVDLQVDRAMQLTEMIARDAEEYLEEQRQLLACPGLVYFGTGRNRYQIEVPDAVVNARRLPSTYSQSSQRRGYRRYTTPRTQQLVELLAEAEDFLESVRKETTQRAFAAFTAHHDAWRAATHCVAVFDVLLSLAKFAEALAARGFDVCRPRIITTLNDYQSAFGNTMQPDVPCLLLTDSRHPTVPRDLPVANDADLRSHAQPITILTGPNMGGKTTLIRQVGLCVVLAQMGAHVPARQCYLTPVDRIFTRVGAHDRLVAGESTFMNELLETRTILCDATRHSLVLLDELGRGTSTYDGLSIAYAAICDLFERTRARTLFSTHFHQLVHQLEEQLGENCADRRIRIGRMSYLLQPTEQNDAELAEKDDSPKTRSQERLTLLFKFEDGACPTSFGLNVARLAQLPDEVIEYAAAKSRYLNEQETILNALWKFQKLLL